MRRDRQRIMDMIEAAAKSTEYIGLRTLKDFMGDSYFQDAIIRRLTILGEAAAKLSAGFRKSHPEIPWQDITGFRHKLVHDYFGVDFFTTWKIATTSVPTLHAQLTQILATEFPEDN